jgi:hypothetical protein
VFDVCSNDDFLVALRDAMLYSVLSNILLLPSGLNVADCDSMLGD